MIDSLLQFKLFSLQNSFKIFYTPLDLVVMTGKVLHYKKDIK